MNPLSTANNRQTLAALLDKIDGAYAANTLRAFRADLEEFIRYCDNHGYSPLPANPDAVAAFIDSVCESGVTSATIRRKLVSIASIHRLARQPDPTKDTDVKLAVRRMHRKLGRLAKQAYGITSPLLTKLLAATGPDLRGQRDRALLHLASETMRRRSELVSLQIRDIAPCDGGAKILLRRSKTDQEGLGTWLRVSQNAWIEIQAWITASKLENGYLLRGVLCGNKITSKLCAGQIGRIYKSLARQAEIDKETVQRISGHSLRVGAAQDMVLSGATLPQIMIKGGWAKVDTVLRYIENTTVNT
jgi:site-specific recombinase XerD